MSASSRPPGGDADGARLGRIGFLVKTYPKISETFILEEILGLERRGLSLGIFSLRRPSDEISHAACLRVRAPVAYVPGTRARELPVALAAHLRLLLRRPRRYLAALAFALATPGRGRIREFLQAGCLSDQLVAAGIGHLHAHFVSEPGGVAELVMRFSGIPYSLSAHAKDIYLSGDGALRRKLQAARFTVTCTESNCAYLAARVCPGTPLTRIYHGVDAGRFVPARPAAGGDGQAPPLLLAVGRLRAKKGFATLVEACRLLRDDGIRLRCQIIGYGEERDRLRAQIAAAGLDGVVQLTGKLNQDQVIARYRAAQVFALPCQVADDGDRDGIPNVLLEAMAMELPVISTPVSGIPEVIEHGHNGLLVPPRHPGALAAAIARLIAEPDLGRRLGAAGRLTVQRQFSNEVNLGRLHDLLREAVHGA